MADAADRAREYQERLNAEALAARVALAPGRRACIDCGEPISVLRQQLGARRCMECQSELEARGR